MSNLILSAFADEYADGLVEQCEALQRFGIEYLELRGVNGKNVAELTTEEAKAARDILASHGIRISAIGSPLGKVPITADLTTHFEKAKRVFETANLMGTKNIRMFSFYLPEGKTRAECRPQILEALHSLLEIAEQFGVTLCHENEALIYGESPECCLDLLTEFRGRLKCVFDMGNFVLDGYDPVKAYRLLLPHIAYFHIKDALYAGAIVPAGKGEAKIREILCDYRARGDADTVITLEPHLQTFSGLNALVGKTFKNPYQYPDQKTAFADAVQHLKGLL